MEFMQYRWYLTVIGSLFLGFRIWLSFFKLRDELGFRRFYVSRFVNIYTCLMMVAGGSVKFLNCIVAACFPAMIITTIWDISFYRRFKDRTYWKKNRKWVIVERITLHPPTQILGIWMYATGLERFFPMGDFLNLIIGSGLVYLTTILFDVRILKKYNWPSGLYLLIVIGLSTSGIIIYSFWPYLFPT
ncbi:MAG: hypothetical protein JW776_04610 [Candidatus Lokiarchaeota archaeon]|nr:hypothetical protein [Candidatus Lokiarchaeota archaeon]